MGREEILVKGPLVLIFWNVLIFPILLEEATVIFLPSFKLSTNKVCRSWKMIIEYL